MTDGSDEPEALRKRKTASTAAVPPSKKKSTVTCPYLGTINRHLLDFDFEKLCSICLSNQHIYACLVCGKYFQGRGPNTYANTHALEEGHFVYMNLHDTRVYWLPENVEVTDASLNDIKFCLNPTFAPEEVNGLGNKISYGKALDGTDFFPGLIGLNNLKGTDFVNVVIQIICTIIPLRNKLLLLDLSTKQQPDPVLASLCELIRKIYNPKNFKGIVSPHEFLQAVGVASEKRFRIGVQSDPLAFFAWLMARLHKKLKNRAGDSVIHDCFQGNLHIKTARLNSDGEELKCEEDHIPFLMLTLDVPPAPIFRDSLNRNMIPHIPIFDLLQKFDGETTQELSTNVVRRHSLWRLPKYLVFHIKRFSKNNFFVEKNPTIVTFPVRNLELSDYVDPDAVDLNKVTRYNLVANVCHEGKPQSGAYRVHIFHAPTKDWYEMEDLRVSEVLAQQIALSESYLQVYQRQDVRLDGSLMETLSEDLAGSALDGMVDGSLFDVTNQSVNDSTTNQDDTDIFADA